MTTDYSRVLEPKIKKSFSWQGKFFIVSASILLVSLLSFGLIYRAQYTSLKSNVLTNKSRILSLEGERQSIIAQLAKNPSVIDQKRLTDELTKIDNMQQFSLRALGQPGSNGAPGAAGTNGTNGLNGTNGSSGAAGLNGNAGAPGPIGIQGVAGTPGPPGPPGPVGATGATGSQGVAGTPGATGSQGPPGPPGSDFVPTTTTIPVTTTTSIP